MQVIRWVCLLLVIHFAKGTLDTENNDDFSIFDEDLIEAGNGDFPDEDLTSFDQNEGDMDSKIEHSRHKRTPGNIPDSVTFELTKVNSVITSMKVGTQVQFQLTVIFPQGDTDINVEIFAPDLSTTIMHVCDVHVLSAGSNLSPDPKLKTPTYDSKTGDQYFYDHATLDFGTIKNSAVDSNDVTKSSIVIRFTATMVYNTKTVDQKYWVNVGAEYNNGQNIWIGQASLDAVTTDEVTILSPILNITGPDVISVGSLAVFQVQSKIPHRYTSVDVEVMAAYSYPTPYTICDVILSDTGSNIACVARSKHSACMKSYNGDRGNWNAKLTLPQIINTRADVNKALTDDDVVKFIVMISVYDNEDVGKEHELFIGVKVGTNDIMTGNVKFTTGASSTPTSTPATSPSFGTPDYQNSGVAKINQPTVVVIEMTIPTGMDTALELTAESPVSITSLFNVCKLRVVSVGLNIGCLPVNDPTYKPDGNAPYHKATLNLGRVKNLALGSNADSSVIKVEVTVTALSHDNNIVDSTQNVVLSVGKDGNKYASETLTFTIAAAFVADVMKKPTLSVVYEFGGQTSSDGGMKAVSLKVTTEPGQLYTGVSVEFIMPLSNNDTLVSVHHAEVTTVGANTPCINAALISTGVSYTKKSADASNYYRAVIPLDTLCNIGTDKNAAANVIKITALVRVEKNAAWVKGEVQYVSAGIKYTNEDLWVGQIAMYIEDTANLIEKGENSPYIGAVIAGDYCEVLPEYPAEFHIILKIPPYSTLPYVVTVSHTDPEVKLCDLRLKSMGTSLDYTLVDFAKKITIGADSLSADLGTVTNPVKSRFMANNVVDENAMVFAMRLKLSKTASSGSTHLVNLTATIGAETIRGVLMVTATDNVSSVAVTSTTDTIAVSSQAVKLTNNIPTAATIAPGETRRLLTELSMNSSVTVNKVTFFVSSATANNNRLQLVNVGVIQVGSHFKCTDQSALEEAVLSSRVSGGIKDMGELKLGYVCYNPDPHKPEDSYSKKILVESIFRLVDTDSGSGSLTVNLGVVMNNKKEVTEIFTWTASTVFVTDLDPVYSFPEPSKIVVVSNTSLEVNIRQRFTIVVDVKMPTEKAFTLTSEVASPVDDTAVMTVHKVSVLCAGVDISSLDSTVNPIETEFKSSLGNNQIDQANTKYGVITNTGFKQRAQVNQTDPDLVTVEFELEMTDNKLTEHLSTHNLNINFKFGNNIASVTIVVKVMRVNNEECKLAFVVNVTEDKVYTAGETVTLSMKLEHTAESQAEPQTVLLAVYIPPFMKYKNHAVNIAPSSFVDSSTVIKLQYPWFLFPDSLSLTLDLEVRTTVSTPMVNSPAVTPVEVVYNLHHRSDSTFTNGQDFSKYVAALYRVNNYLKEGSCVSALGMQSGAIKDCQLSDFLSADPAKGPTQARYSVGTGWAPFIRSGPFNKHRYLQIFFGNKVRVTRVRLHKPAGAVGVVTKLQLSYSNDGKAWVKGQELSPDASYTTDLVVARPRNTRYLRLYVNEHSGVDSAEVLFTVEVYGCSTTSDVADVCATVVADTKVPDFSNRGMLQVDNKLYFCDRNPEKGMSMHCFVTDTASKGLTWTALDPMVGSVLGYDPTEGRIHAASIDGLSYLTSKDGLHWSSSQPTKWTSRKDSSEVVKAMDIPWVATKLTSPTPHADYTINNIWAAKFDGIYFKDGGTWKKVLDWINCCP